MFNHVKGNIFNREKIGAVDKSYMSTPIQHYCWFIHNYVENLEVWWIKASSVMLGYVTRWYFLFDVDA